MATVLDEFVITLGLDPAKFDAGQRKAADSLRKFETEFTRRTKNIEQSGAKTLDFFEGIKKIAALGAFAIVGEQVGVAVNALTSMDARTGRLSLTLGISAQDIVEWQHAIKTMGGSTESANAALGGMNGELTRFAQTGESNVLPVLQSLGVTMYKTNGQLKTASEIYKDISAAVAGMDARTAAGRLSLLPGINEDMINLLIQGLPKVRELLEEGRRLVPVTEANTKAAQEYQHALADLGDSFTGLTRQIVGPFLPALKGMLDTFSEILITVRSLIKDFGTLIEKIPFIGDAMKEMKGVIGSGETLHGAFGSSEHILRSMGLNETADQLYGRKNTYSEMAKRLKGETSSSGKKISGFSSDEQKIRAVAAMIEAEAGGEGRLGMEAVGAVMGNRAASNFGGFGADPYSQAYARGGQEFQGTPRQPSATAMDVARRLYAGQLNDPTAGSIYYANPGASTAAWARRLNRNNALMIGNHAFTNNTQGVPFKPGLETGIPGPGAWMSPGVMGAQGANYAGGDKNTTITVGDVHVNAPNATDSKSIAQAVDNDLKLAILAGSANFGQIA